MHMVREMEKHQRSEHLCDGNKNSDNAQNKTFSLKSLMFFPRRSEVTHTDRRRRRQNRNDLQCWRGEIQSCESEG